MLVLGTPNPTKLGHKNNFALYSSGWWTSFDNLELSKVAKSLLL
jgi:hypothetical protein